MDASKTIILIYEPEQISEMERLLTAPKMKGVRAPLIVALDLEVEYLLQERNIAFRSGVQYRSDTTGERSLYAEQWTEQIRRDTAWKSFTYRGISLIEPLLFSLQLYIQHALYYVDIITNLLEAHPEVKKIIIFPSAMRVFPTSGYLASHEIVAPVACARLVAERRGIEVEAPESTARFATTSISTHLFGVKRALFGLFLWLLNRGVAMVRRPQSIRLLISDYWRNIAPLAQEMKNTEFIFLDRMEALNAGWKNIWRFRMRFLHLEHYASRQHDRTKVLHRCIDEWKRMSAKKDFLSTNKFRGYSIAPLMRDALNALVTDGMRDVLENIDGTYTLLGKLRPQVILLRVSISRQPHFAVLALVAKELGIPSLELQHGLEYVGPGSSSKHHMAKFIGVYGKIIAENLQNVGYAPERLMTVGSPRFDRYTKTSPRKKHTSGCVFLCIAPGCWVSDAFDSYNLSDYMYQLAAALKKIHGSMVIIKLRSDVERIGLYNGIIARAFAGIPHTVVARDPLSELFSKADVVVSIQSTVILEALQCGMPTVVMGLNPMEVRVIQRDFSPYKEARALRIAFTQDELKMILTQLAESSEARAELRQGALQFVEKNYSFDGKSSERVAALIRSLAKRPTL